MASHSPAAEVNPNVSEIKTPVTPPQETKVGGLWRINVGVDGKHQKTKSFGVAH
jgi:hypothetical protein